MRDATLTAARVVMPQPPKPRAASRRTPRVLVTGFEPFGGDAVNPSAMLAQSLEGHSIAGHHIAARVLPCTFDTALVELDRAIDEVEPVLVLATGLAAGRPALSFERVAINLVDARIADNAGVAPVDTRVVARSAPDAWFTNLPVKAMAQAAIDVGVPAELSLSAGTFVCNAVFFGLMQRVARELRRTGRAGLTKPTATAMRGGFMHVPSLAVDGITDEGAMTLDDMVAGTRAALAVALRRRDDLAITAGRVA
jgi:pyroglutamyl-peptidase